MQLATFDTYDGGSTEISDQDSGFRLNSILLKTGFEPVTPVSVTGSNPVLSRMLFLLPERTCAKLMFTFSYKGRHPRITLTSQTTFSTRSSILKY
jgi:hypothetical protein